uniref:3-oxoacyl-[acyl-carrier-protein] synthase III C-terminal domain-containing protein n=1 Tax=Neisseria dentiae TaxID=194197 RepID=UPI00359F14A7
KGWKTFDSDYCHRHSLMALKQDVKLLNENIIRYTVEKPLAQIAAKHGLKAEDIDWFLPHYSSGFFRDKVAAGLENIGFGIGQEKWFTNLAGKGNTGSASIYIILEEFMRTFKLENGQKILCYIPESGRFSTCFMLLEAVEAA